MGIDVPNEAEPKHANRKALILGGAGFVGSAIARALVQANWTVSIIDNLDPETFADCNRLGADAGAILFENHSVELLPDLASRIAASDIVVDAIGWTRHSEGERNPERDLNLNLGVHLPVFGALTGTGPLFVHLGSRHQFGGTVGDIDDDAGFAPLDAQSIHKSAAEEHLRRICRKTGASAVVLRVGNCIGPGQPIGEGDVGLIGTFIRELREGKTVPVFGGPRRRNLCFTPDIGTIVLALADRSIRGFVPMNVPGLHVDIGELAECLARGIGRGAVVREPMPEDIARREIGTGRFLGSALAALIPEFVPTSMEDAVEVTLSSIGRGRGQDEKTEHA